MQPRGTFCTLGMALTAILFWCPAAWASTALCLGSYPAGTPVETYPITKSGTFALGFIHSVSLTPVLDTYQIQSGQIIQTSEIFQAHGAGLPSMGDEVDATGWRHQDGQFILDLNRHIGTMIVRIQPAYQNTLHINDQIIPLASFGHAALRIAVCDT